MFVGPENYQKQVIFGTNTNDMYHKQLLCKTGKLAQEFNWRDIETCWRNHSCCGKTTCITYS